MIKIRRKNLKTLALAFFCFCLFAGGFFCLRVQANDLELSYPQMPKVQTPTTTATSLESYVKYFFNFAFAIAGLILFAVLVQGGFLYLSSAGNASKTKTAKDKITSGFLGVAVVLCSWLLLYALNPQMLFFSFEKKEIPASITVPVEEKADTKRTFLQIPIGALIEKALTGNEAQAKLNEVNQKDKEIKDKAEELKQLDEELKDLALACSCGNSTCGSTAEGCAGKGCQISCDRNAINAKIDEIKNFIEELKTFQKDAFVATRWDFDSGKNELKIAASLLTGACESPVMTQNDMMEAAAMVEKDGFEINTMSGWPSDKISFDGKTIDDPVTFYCENPDIDTALRTASLEDVAEIVSPEDSPALPSKQAPKSATPPAGSQDYTLRDNQNNYPYLSQSDSKQHCISYYGCGPTSLATVIRYFDPSSTVTPENLAEELRKQGGMFSCSEGMTSAAAASSYITSKYGINHKMLARNPQTIKNEILQDHPVLIASCVFGVYLKYRGHLLVINGVNYTGDTINYFQVMDPCHHLYKTITLSELSQCGGFVYSFSK
jgi:hypothetical protein